jgi:hypothetical protein
MHHDPALLMRGNFGSSIRIDLVLLRGGNKRCAGKPATMVMIPG